MPEQKHGAPISERGLVRDRGVHLAFGEWLAWCSCGFLEPGWPNYAIAKASLDNHIRRCSRERT